MATPTNSSGQTKSVDASLWWDPFSLMLTQLENVSLSDAIPQSLVNPNFLITPLSLSLSLMYVYMNYNLRVLYSCESMHFDFNLNLKLMSVV